MTCLCYANESRGWSYQGTWRSIFTTIGPFALKKRIVEEVSPNMCATILVM